MALTLLDRVQETATANTTVSFSLTGAVVSYQAFSSIGNGNTTYYGATDGTNWEVGIGTYVSSGNTLTRTTILSSSNSGAAVTFSGSVTVWVDYPAGKSVNEDASNNVTLPAQLLLSNQSLTATLAGGQIQIGSATSFSDTGMVISSVASSNSYYQHVIQNTNSGTAASAEFIAYNDQGTAANNFATVGINSSGYSGTGSINAPGYGYFLTGSTDLVLGTIGNNKIHFATNSQATDAVTIGTDNSLTVNGTITGQTEVLKGTGQNLFLQSSSLTNAAWTTSNLTVTGSQTDPFGGTTAVLLNDGTNNGTHPISQTVSLYAQTYTFSVYVKAGTANYVALYSSNSAQGAFFNLTTGAFNANMINAPVSYSSSNAGSGWWRLSITVLDTSAGNSTLQILVSEDGTNYSYTGTSKTITVAAPQLEVGNLISPYTATTSSQVYGTPTLSFSGVAGLGLQSDGSLYVSPAGTGALQAQATTSSTVGGNARGANAVDWQTSRSAASQVSSGQYSNILGGIANTSASYGSVLGGGSTNYSSGTVAFLGGGGSNTTGGNYSSLVGGGSNSALGYYNFIGGGFTNSATSGSAVTTQNGTMNGTTAVTLSGSNASIKVGQYITGTSIAQDTYVAAISGTSLTLSKNASGSSTSTLSFYTPHGVVVGGGNNQATGSYSFIGGGGDAGTAANRNVASGAWSAILGGFKNTASGIGAVVAGGGTYDGANGGGNLASGVGSFVANGWGNSSINAATCAIGSGMYVSGNYSTGIGYYGTTRGITGNIAFAANSAPIGGNSNQAALLVIGKQTTDATATVLTSDGGAGSTTNQVIMPDNSAYYFQGEVVSGVTGGGNSKGWTISGLIKRGSGVASTTLVGSTVTSLYADVGASTWTIALAADTTNGGLKVTFTGQASTTIRTVCQIRTTEMAF